MSNITYNEFINNILENRGRFACDEGYHERHHIIPRCIGGTDDEENLIDLYAREHFIAHKLLALENPNNDSLIFAWCCMAFAKNEDSKRYIVTPNEYEEARIALSESKKGKHPTKESRQKMSKSQQKRLANAKDNPMYGKHHTEETKQKIRKAIKGKYKGENSPLHGKTRAEETKIKMSESLTRNPVIQLGMNGEFIAEYRSAYKAYLETGVNNTNILNCCYGGCKSAGGFMWLFKNEYDENKTYTYQDNSKRPVVQLDLFGNFIKEHISISEASKEIGGYNCSIHNACSRNSHMAYGFLWIFKDEYDPLMKYTYSNNRRIPVVCLDIDGNYICEYESAAEACKSTGINSGSIIKCCKGKQKTSGGFKWMYKDKWEVLQEVMNQIV